MSPLNPSRANLADIISLISHSDFTDRQKQEVRSAVRTVARLFGAEPGAFRPNRRRCGAGLRQLLLEPMASRAGAGTTFGRSLPRRWRWRVP